MVQHVPVDDLVEYFLPEDDSCECIVKSSSWSLSSDSYVRPLWDAGALPTRPDIRLRFCCGVKSSTSMLSAHSIAGTGALLGSRDSITVLRRSCLWWFRCVKIKRWSDSCCHQFYTVEQAWAKQTRCYLTSPKLFAISSKLTLRRNCEVEVLTRQAGQVDSLSRCRRMHSEQKLWWHWSIMAALRYSLQMGHRRCESISRRGRNSLGQSEGSVMSNSMGVRMESVDGRRNVFDGN